MPEPYNSSADDFGFEPFDEHSNWGYFTSNRLGGKGDDDIYYFTKKAVPCVQLVSGKVTNTKYKVGINMADIKVYNLFGDVIKTTQTDKEGNYKIEVRCNTKVKIEASKPNHTKAEKELEISGTNGNEIKDVNFELSDYGDLVVIEDDVEIGACTTVDRATLGSTIIRKGVKLDNHIQVAHNVEIGENTVIAAQTGIAGTTKIGKNCLIGGQVGFAGHLVIGDGVKIQAQSGIGKNLEAGEVVQGSPAFNYGDFAKSFVHFRNLPKIVTDLEELKNKIK